MGAARNAASGAPVANTGKKVCETAAVFAAHRHAQGRQISTVNSSLQILRRMLRLSVEWGVSDSAVPMIRMMPGERRREHVVTVEEEARYLAAAPELVANVAAVL